MDKDVLYKFIQNLERKFNKLKYVGKNVEFKFKSRWFKGKVLPLVGYDKYFSDAFVLYCNVTLRGRFYECTVIAIYFNEDDLDIYIAGDGIVRLSHLRDVRLYIRNYLPYLFEFISMLEKMYDVGFKLQYVGISTFIKFLFQYYKVVRHVLQHLDYLYTVCSLIE